MPDKKVKGSILLDYIRMVKGNKDKDWDKYLTPEDWEIVNGRVLPSVWYSFETFQRCGLAAFHLLADGNIDIVRAWGRISMEQFTKGVYKSVIADPDPMKALDRFVRLRIQFFDFAELELEKVGEKHAKIRVAAVRDEEGNEPYCAQLMGGFERLVELAGGANPKITIESKQWEGAPGTEFNITWE